MSSQRGKIIILTAPSGGGKSTMAKRLLSDFPQIKFSVSATTRAPRKGENNGVDYYFLSRKEFQERIDNEEFLEWEEFYNGTMYGTLKADVESELNKGYFVMLDIDVLGAVNVKRMYREEALSIFISPPSFEVLEKRLRNRGTESEKSLDVRLKRARKEIEYAERFDLKVINIDIESTYRKIKSTVQTFLINSKQ